MSNNATSVTHKHVAINKPDSVGSECMPHQQRDHSLIHVVILPVVCQCIVPLADGMVRRPNNIAIVEAGDEVNTLDGVCRIEETKCAIFVTRDKLDVV